MTVNSVKKHCFLLLNVKWIIKIKFKTFYLNFWNFYILLQTGLVLLEIFAYLSNKQVVYGPELGLLKLVLSACWFFKKSTTLAKYHEKTG